MNSWLPIFWLFFSAVTAVADDVLPAVESPPPSPEIQKILADWRERAESSDHSVREWTVTRRLHSEDFGVSERSESPLRVRVHRQGEQFLLEGESAPPAALSKLTWGLARKENTTTEEFQAALADRFEKPTPVPIRLPYQFFHDPTEERHLWQEATGKPAAVAICPPGESAACFERPLLSYLLEAEACLTGKEVPSAENMQLEYELLPEIKSLAGRPCQILQVWRTNTPKRQLLREFWLELGSGNRVRRCILPAPDLVTIQFDEFTEDQTPFPQRVTLLLVTSSRDVADQLIAVAQTVQPNASAGTSLLKTPLPSDTLVADFILQKRHVMTREGTFRDISLNDLPILPGGLLDRGFQRLNFQSGLMVSILQWLSWPWILLPMGGFCVLWVGISKALRIGQSIPEVSVAAPKATAPIAQNSLPSEQR